MSGEDTKPNNKPTIKNWFYKNTLSLIVCIGMMIILYFMMNNIVKLVIGTQENPAQINIQVIDKEYNTSELSNEIISFHKDQLNDQNFKVEKLFFDIENLVTEQWQKRSDGFTYKVAAIIAAATIFFTILIVVISLFQYLKTKKFDEEYNSLNQQTKDMLKSFNDMKILLDDQCEKQQKTRDSLDLEKEKNQKIREDLEKQKEEIMNNNIKLMYMSEANTLTQEAMKDNDIKKYDDAIKKLNDIENIDWKNEINTLEYKIKMYKSFNYNNRAISKKQMGEIEETLTDYNKAIELNPKYANAYYNRGVLKTHIVDMEGALADYNKAIELNSEDANAYNNRANLKKDMGKQEEALADYDKAIELNPEDANAYNNRANLKDDMGKQEEALTDYDKAIELNSNCAKAYCNRAYVKIKLNPPDFKDAIEDLEIAFKLDSNSGYIKHSMAEILFRQDKFEKSIENKSEVFEYLDIATKIAENENDEELLNDCETLKNEIDEYYK